MTAHPEPQEWKKKFADHLTPHNIIPCLIIFLIFSFFFFELILPEIRDLTAFWFIPHGVVKQDPIKAPSRALPFHFLGTHGFYTHKRLYQIKPLNDYKIEARVLHTRHYWSDTNSADLIPFDMGLGWGVLSDDRVLKNYFTFHHSNLGGRLLWASTSSDTPPEFAEELQAGLHYSNNHLIPASDEVFGTLEKASAGDFIQLTGFLVDVTRPDKPKWRWATSQYERDDPDKRNHWGSGDAQANMTSCDTMFVTEAKILEKP